jgi:hypothetical protein
MLGKIEKYINFSKILGLIFVFIGNIMLCHHDSIIMWGLTFVLIGWDIYYYKHKSE